MAGNNETTPTASEVIAAAEEALARIAGYGDVFAYRATELNPAEEVREAIALIARYKEANSETTAR